jgi:hypothetical protein
VCGYVVPVVTRVPLVTPVPVPIADHMDISRDWDLSSPGTGKSRGRRMHVNGIL